MARGGEGPGELSNASSVAVLPDGRILAHEPGDMLVKVLGPAPGDRALWTYTPGAIVVPVKPLRIDRSGRIFVPAAGTTSNGDFVQYVFVMGSDGVVVDSIGNNRVQVFGPGAGVSDRWRYDAGQMGSMGRG